MTEQLKEIGQRLTTLREIMDISVDQLAERCGVDRETYLEYEKGERDFSFSFLYNAANELGVDVVDLMDGESPKLMSCCLVRKGMGLEITRRQAYSYKHLAATFRNKMSEPFMVTVEPKDGEEAPVLHSHDGQEFNYMVEGSMNFYLGDMTYVLNEGDSIYFNSGLPHAMKALGGKAAKFLAVVMNK